jgi:hypothetical protein
MTPPPPYWTKVQYTAFPLFAREILTQPQWTSWRWKKRRVAHSLVETDTKCTVEKVAERIAGSYIRKC